MLILIILSNNCLIIIAIAIMVVFSLFISVYHCLPLLVYRGCNLARDSWPDPWRSEPVCRRSQRNMRPKADNFIVISRFRINSVPILDTPTHCRSASEMGLIKRSLCLTFSDHLRIYVRKFAAVDGQSLLWP